MTVSDVLNLNIFLAIICCASIQYDSIRTHSYGKKWDANERNGKIVIYLSDIKDFKFYSYH
jgi:hypothetical protein